MKFTPELGMAAPELGWVPSPTFVLRRAAVLDHVRSWTPGRVLEMGCGSGALLHDLARRGFSGVGVESSTEARVLAERLTSGLRGFRVASQVPLEPTPFDYLLACEVLEHVADDRGALAAWSELLRDGGLALLSVPAHRRRWDVTDVLAGHFRRYDREDVLGLVKAAGLRLESIETYGFPATWLIARVRRAVRGAEARRKGLDVARIAVGDSDLTSRSGIERSVETRLFPFYGRWPGRLLLRAATYLQRGFRATELGISFVVTARR